jgi:hypothetical protein
MVALDDFDGFDGVACHYVLRVVYQNDMGVAAIGAIEIREFKKVLGVINWSID